MKKKLAALVASLAVVPALAFAVPAFAGSTGKLAGGDNYVAKNITKGGDYSDNTAATCNDTVQYSMQLSNTEFDALDSVTLKVTLPSQGGESTATATTNLGGTTGASDTTTVTLSGTNASQSLVAGTTTLYDDSGKALKTLPDTVATSGVNIGALAGSTTEYVNFQVKVNCPTPPKQIQVCDLSSMKVITIDEDQFDSSKYSKDLTKCQSTPPTQIKVCKLDTKQIVTINESAFDSSKYSKDLNDCKTTPPANKIQVCDLTNKSIVTIDESAYDSSKYSKDLNDCQVVATTTLPTELPNTGAGNVVAVFFGAIVAGTVAYRVYLHRKLARN